RGRAAAPAGGARSTAGEHPQPRAGARELGTPSTARGRATRTSLRQLQRGPGGLHGRPTPLALEQLGKHALADCDHLRVELRPGTFVEPTNRFLQREALAVGPVGRHRVVGVANEDDPRLDRNVLAPAAVGVTGPVVALVTVPD